MTGGLCARAGDTPFLRCSAALDEHRNPEPFRVDAVSPVVPCDRVVKMR
jgi:hypothetical protein